MAKKYDLKLKGYVGGPSFDRDYVDWFLGKNHGKPVSILIDSTGGDLFAGSSVAASFKQHGQVHVHYVGYNASAATVASMGAKRVTIDPAAMYLVHKCSQLVFEVAYCNADELEAMLKGLDKTRRDLAKIDLNVAAMYAARCKKKKEDLLDLMKEGAWLSAEEALEWGFVDEICEDPDAQQQAQPMNSVVALAMQENGMPLPPGVTIGQPGLLQRILNSISRIFDNQPTNINITMANNIPQLLAVLSMDSLELHDGNATIAEAQLAQIEQTLAEREARIAELEAANADLSTQIENLKKQPAEKTHEVVHDGNESPSEISDFISAAKEAREMFESIP